MAKMGGVRRAFVAYPILAGSVPWPMMPRGFRRTGFETHLAVIGPIQLHFAQRRRRRQEWDVQARVAC
jgi:hypothetical protein